MTDVIRFNTLASRQTAVEQMFDALSQEDSFSARMAAKSLDFHLSDLRNQQQEALELGQQKEVLEIRLMGQSVNTGSAPIELFSKLLKELSLTIHRAANKLTTGKDSTKASNQIKGLLDLRFAGTAPGSTRVMMTANSVGDLAGNITRETLEQLFDVLESTDENVFLEHASNIGSHSLASINGLVSNINKQGLNVKISWPDSESGKTREWVGSKHDIELFQAKFASIDIRSVDTVNREGVVTLISDHGKLNLRLSDGEEIKTIFSPELLSSVKQFRIGDTFNGVFQKTSIGNSKLNVKKQTYRLINLR